MTFSMWRAVTDAGDSAVVGPLVVVTSGVLWAFGSRRGAWLLVRAWLLAGLGIGTLKVLLLSCGLHWQPGLTSPSGHACMSVVAYGSLAAIFTAGKPLAARLLAGALAVLVIGAIAASRILLGAHTVIEVVVGLEVGVAALFTFLIPWREDVAARLDPRALAVAVFVTAVLLTGTHAPAESYIRHLARRLNGNCGLYLLPERANLG